MPTPGYIRHYILSMVTSAVVKSRIGVLSVTYILPRVQTLRFLLDNDIPLHVFNDKKDSSFLTYTYRCKASKNAEARLSCFLWMIYMYVSRC